MARKKPLWKRILRISLISITSIALILVILFYAYCNSLWRVNPISVGYYRELKTTLMRNYRNANFLVISGYRHPWHNAFLHQFGGAAEKSLHMKGLAIDILVFDINRDGVSNTKDVDIVYNILDKEIIGNNGGIGTYKGQPGFINRQMIHFDCRGYRQRWAH